MTRARIATVVVLAGATAAAASALPGCLDRDLTPLNPCTVSGVIASFSPNNIDKVDMLFMIDNSNSMAEEQLSLASELPRLMTVLATGDQDGDGTRDFPPVRSLQVGVVSSDMGTGGFEVDTCDEPSFGHDGILRTEGRTDITGCTESYPNFLEFSPESSADPDTFARDFNCVAQLGTGGCGFEQQLEAVLKAATPSGSPTRFNMGTTGHADRANAGFVREQSLLAVILLTDEEDCSAVDPELFNPSSGVYPGNLNLRCFSYPTALHPVERYVDGLLALRSDPDLLVFAAIAGVPPELVADPGAVDYDAILADEQMREVVDAADPNRLRASCNVAGRGLAFPPRRIVRVAQQLEARDSNAVVQSICQADFRPALDAIIEKIADVLNQTCLPRDLIPSSTGDVGCDVVEVLPATGDFTTCDSIAGRELIRTEPDGRQVCRVTQLIPDRGAGTVPTGAGWYYDDYTDDVRMTCGADGQRIAYTEGNAPKTGSQVRLECLQPVQQVPGSTGTEITIGSSCAAADNCGSAGGLTGALACDAESNTCQKPCGGDADCSAAGLAGWKCNAASSCENPVCTQ